MAFIMRWDDEVTRVENEEYLADIRTGMSQQMRNRFEVLLTLSSKHGVEVWRTSLAQIKRAANVAEAAANRRVNVECVGFNTAHGPFTVVGMWAFIPNGAVQRGRVHGDFKLIIVALDEIEAARRLVFAKVQEGHTT